MNSTSLITRLLRLLSRSKPTRTTARNVVTIRMVDAKPRHYDVAIVSGNYIVWDSDGNVVEFKTPEDWEKERKSQLPEQPAQQP